MYQLMKQEVHAFSDDDAHCGVHPNPLGHRCSPCCTLLLCPKGTGYPGQPNACRALEQSSIYFRLISKGGLRRYYGDLLIAAMQDQAYAAFTIPDDHMQYPHGFEALTGLPPPMLEDNFDFDSECLSGEQLREVGVPELSEVGGSHRGKHDGHDSLAMAMAD